MAEISGQYYSEDIVYRKVSELDLGIFDTGTVLYEVLRVLNGTVLFLEDHILRFQESVRLSGYAYSVSIPVIHFLLRNLIKRNEIATGNIKIVLHFNQRNHPVLYTYFIPHSYPAPDMYERGVEADFYQAIRHNPNIKKMIPEMIRNIREFIRTENLYDALLVDEKGYISEGSKTNIFFIKKMQVWTAPPDKVLKGITRGKVIEVCRKLQLEVLEESIHTKDLHQFEAAFFSGTSPKVLPVRRIANIELEVKNKIMRSIMKGYDDLITSYIYHWD